SKEPPTTEVAGVSTYLALTFGTLLSSQGTDAPFVLTLSGFPPDVSFGVSVFLCVVAFPTLSDCFQCRFPRCFPGFPLSRFPFPAVPTLSVEFRLSDHPFHDMQE
ncbi:hypothetical protein, partial [Streptomyces sp. NPDC058657]|uniref:hypothetical protein n=1 Tax=Streptomyces sp. NPDC058657 TaxID=3346579 RepID=UPI00365165F1